MIVVKVIVVVVLVALVVAPTSADQFVLLSGGNSPTTAQFAQDGCIVTLMGQTANGAPAPFAMKLDDNLTYQAGVNLCVPVDSRIQRLVGKVEVAGGGCTGVKIDGTPVPLVDGSAFVLPVAGLVAGRHIIRVGTTKGAMDIAFEVVAQVIDLGAIPGSIAWVQEAQSPAPTPLPPTPPPIPLPVTLDPESVKLTPEAEAIFRQMAAEMVYSGPLLQRGLIRMLGTWETVLVILPVDQQGNIPCIPRLEVKCGGRVARWLPRGDRLFKIPPNIHNPLGVAPGEEVVISLEGREIARVHMPDKGWGLWLPVVIQGGGG